MLLKDHIISKIEEHFDMFGDRSMIAFPTPGHTLGHQSLYVKLSTGNALIYCTDAFCTTENMDKLIAPWLASDIPGKNLNIKWFNLQELTGIKIIPSSDPEYWAKRSWAPKELVP
jgi:glyoxylase-like metal-dependent hydrolase (beta-lactamase superfamily II)